MLVCIEPAEVFSIDLECHRLLLACFEEHLLKSLEFFCRTVDRCLRISDIELYDLGSVIVSGVSHVNRNLERARSCHGRFCRLCIAILECSVAESVSERELNRDILCIIPSVAYVYTFIIVCLPILVARLLDARILALGLDRAVLIAERNRERKSS